MTAGSEAGGRRVGEGKGGRIAGGGMKGPQGAGGIGEAQHLGALVESLAGRVVQRGADDLHVQRGTDQHQLRVTAAHGEVQKGEGGHGPVLAVPDEMCHHVGLYMVYRQQGDVQRLRQGPCEAGTHEQGADQARSVGERHGGKILLRDACCVQGLADHRYDVLLMGPAGQLRHHAAPLGMNLLGGHHVGAELTVHQYGGRGLITRTFDAENDLMHGLGQERG